MEHVQCTLYIITTTDARNLFAWVTAVELDNRLECTKSM